MFRRDLRLEPKYHLRPLFNLPVAILQVNVEISWQTFQVNDVTITLNPGNEINAMIVCFQVYRKVSWSGWHFFPLIVCVPVTLTMGERQAWRGHLNRTRREQPSVNASLKEIQDE